MNKAEFIEKLEKFQRMNHNGSVAEILRATLDSVNAKPELSSNEILEITQQYRIFCHSQKLVLKASHS
jgi:hypothetical protein